jgi:hypothetical protein
MRTLEDLHNELAHIRMFPEHYESYTEALSRRVAVTGQIKELLRALSDVLDTQRAA